MAAGRWSMESSRCSMGEAFVWPVRVYYEDTDAEGVVYYANYLKFFERARTEWLRARRVDLDTLQRDDGVVFVVAETNVRYLAPARFNDELRVSAEVERASAVQLWFRQHIRRAHDNELVCSATVRVASVAHPSFRPARLPAWVRERLL